MWCWRGRGYGVNESFAGAAGVTKFEADLATFIAGQRANRTDGKPAPAVALIVPVALGAGRTRHSR